MPLSPFYANIRSKIGTDLLMVPGVCAIIFNDKNEVLLQQRADNARWGLPGGMLDPGEHPAQAIIREVHEETALSILPVAITGVYLTRVITYSNGDQSQYIITAFRCRVTAGTPRVNDEESLDIRWFPTDQSPPK